MFCQKCGKEIPDNSGFCPGCGTAVGQAGQMVQATSELKQKKKKHTLRNALIAVGALLVVVVAISALGGGDSDSSGDSGGGEISTVRNGYLGLYTDMTVAELLEGYYGGMYESYEWSGGTAKDDKYIVEFKAVSDYMGTVRVQFKLYDDQIFKVSGFDDGSGETETAYTLNQLNFAYFTVKSRTSKLSDEEQYKKLDKIPGSAVLYGASKAYKGDRSKIGEEYYNQSPINRSVKEMLDLYFDNPIAENTDVYVAGMDDSYGTADDYGYEVAGGDMIHEDLSSYLGTLYNAMYVDSFFNLCVTDDGKLCAWSGDQNTDENAFRIVYDRYEIKNNNLLGYIGNACDEFGFSEDGLVAVLWDSKGSTHYAGYYTEEAYFREYGDFGDEPYDPQWVTNYISSADELKEFARDNANIGQMVTVSVTAGGTYGNTLTLCCYEQNDSAPLIIEATAIDGIDGMNIFSGDLLNYTGIYEGLTDGGTLKFRTIEVEFR